VLWRHKASYSGYAFQSTAYMHQGTSHENIIMNRAKRLRLLPQRLKTIATFLNWS